MYANIPDLTQQEIVHNKIHRIDEMWDWDNCGIVGVNFKRNKNGKEFNFQRVYLHAK